MNSLIELYLANFMRVTDELEQTAGRPLGEKVMEHPDQLSFRDWEYLCAAAKLRNTFVRSKVFRQIRIRQEQD